MMPSQKNMLQVIFQPTPFSTGYKYILFREVMSFRSAKPNLQFTFLVVGITNHAPGSQNQKGPKVPNSKKKKNTTQLNSNFLKSTEPHHPQFCCSTFFVQPALPTSVARLGIFLFGSSRSNPFPLGTTFFRPRKRETDHQKHGKKQKRLQPI